MSLKIYIETTIPSFYFETRKTIHLALASFYECDVLLTWNCAHLANPNKFRHIRNINQRLGLAVPAVITPLELLGESL